MQKLGRREHKSNSSNLAKVYSLHSHLAKIISPYLNTLQLVKISLFTACLGISGMKRNEEHWGGGISIISQNFSKIPFNPLPST
jgi:hypothetical protein